MTKYLTAIICFLIALISADATYAQQPDRAWVEVNYLSAHPNQDERFYSSSPEAPAGLGTILVQDLPEMPWANGFDVAGGYTLWAGLGVGVRWLRTRSDYTIDVHTVVLQLDGPFGLDGPFPSGTDNDEIGDLRRTDTAVDVLATYTVPVPSRAVTVRVFGGPTYFSVDQAMVQTFEFAPTYEPFGPSEILRTADITSIQTEDAEGRGWGYNVGADVAYFFSRHIGVGGGVRYNHGTISATLPVQIPDRQTSTLTNEAELQAGHLTLAVGARLRF